MGRWDVPVKVRREGTIVQLSSCSLLLKKIWDLMVPFQGKAVGGGSGEAGVEAVEVHTTFKITYTVPPKTVQVFLTFLLDCMYLVNHGTYGHVHRLVRKPFIAAF